MSLDAALSLDETAAAVGLSGERFRRVWRDWVKAYAFPPPFKTPSPRNHKGAYGWRPAPVATWLEARERALGHGLAAPDPANDQHEPVQLAAAHGRLLSSGRIARERAAMALRMKGQR